jgi:hypothetical protein
MGISNRLQGIISVLAQHSKSFAFCSFPPVPYEGEVTGEHNTDEANGDSEDVVGCAWLMAVGWDVEVH